MEIANAAAQFTEYQSLSETRLADMVAARQAIEHRLDGYRRRSRPPNGD